MLYCFAQPKSSLRRLGFLLLLACLPAQGADSDSRFLLGYEAQLYRPGISPNPFQILSAGAEIHRDEKQFHANVDLRISLNPENPKVWALRNPDAFAGWKISPSFRFSLGRKQRRWNELDAFWNLSFIQPIDQWDRFRPAQQGLIGAFLTWDFGPLEFHVFGTHLMLPENIPNVVIENGRFASYHPQAVSSTPQTVTLLNQSTPIFYEIDYPSLTSVVFRPGIMASLETPARSDLIFRLLYGFKPYNYFTYALRGGLSIPNVQVQIQIKPRLNQHQVIAGDLGYRVRGSPLSFGVSGLFDQPATEILTSDYTYAPVSPAWLASPWAAWETAAFTLRASQLFWYGGTEADIGPFANPGAVVISSHVFYRNATQIAALIPLPFLSPGSRLEGRWIHEYEISANLLGGDLLIPIRTRLGEIRLVAGGDLVQSALDANPNRGSEMLIDLRTLDRFRLGVSFAI